MHNAIFTRPLRVYPIKPGSVSNEPGPREQLESKGVLRHLPTIELKKSALPNGFKEVVEKSDLIILSSPSGIFFFHQHLKEIISSEKEIMEIMSQKVFGLIGKTSYDFFLGQFEGIETIIYPPKGNENAKALAGILLDKIKKDDLFQAQSRDYNRLIFIPRGDIGTAKWHEYLKDVHGVEIVEKIIYENTPCIDHKNELILEKGKEADFIFFSPSAVKALVEITEANPAKEEWTAWCIGKTTQKAAFNHGFQNIYLASSATEKAMLEDYIKIRNISL